MVLKHEHAYGADFPIPKLPPADPPLSDTPDDLTRFCQGVLYSLSEPVSPVVLKSLILKTDISFLFIFLRALSKKSIVFVLYCLLQYFLHLSKTSINCS